MSIPQKILLLCRCTFVLACLHFSNIAVSQEYEVERCTFNSDESDFSGVFHNKNIVFCSTRAKSNLSFDEDSLTLYYTDLYLARKKPNGTYDNAEILKGNVNTDYNEGQATFSSDGKQMYYTGNLKKSLNNKFDKTSEYKLGIFIAEEVNGQWIARGEFPYNSPNGKFSIAHPSLSQNDSILYFCSNMPGGKGNSDIYRSKWQNGKWSAPENLGSKVNTKGNEFFPFINEFNVLYFATNAREDSEGMDIYYSLYEEGEYQKPVRLNNSINSEFDEFGYQELAGINQGCFSSNRNDLQDDVFLFKKYLNTFNDCHENYEANFCYHLYDEKLTQIDSIPIAYEWIMGDGTILSGEQIEYCYKDFGHFHVELNVIDTITKSVFKKISETDIVISRQDKPYILSHDTIYEHIPFECMAEFISFNAFEVDKVEWEMDDGSKYIGREMQHVFNTPGLHQVKCGVSGKRKENGVLPKICVYKNVICLTPADGIEMNKVLTCCDKREYEKIAMHVPTMTQQIQSGQLEQIHKIVIAESKRPLPDNDIIFEKIENQITEIRTDSSYQYAIAEANSWEELLPLFSELKSAGVEKMFAIELSAAELKNNTIRIIPLHGPQTPEIQKHDEISLSANSTLTTTDKAVKPPTEIVYRTDHVISGVTQEPVSPIIFQDTIPTVPLESTSKTLYRISLFQSENRTPFNDPKFRNIKVDISELQNGEQYEYTVMAVPQVKDLSNLLVEIKRIDFPQARIDSFNISNLNQDLIRVGRYIEPKNADRLNIEFSKLADIKFEYNSSVIKSESFKNLNYISAMLKLEENFTLKICAHTCSVGGSNFNQKLSEERAKSVLAYFIQKGIAKERLITQGFGLTQPLQTNETEMGRSANRRVEFTIVFEIDKH